MEFAVVVLLALVAVAITVTPGIQNHWWAAAAWIITGCYAIWLIGAQKKSTPRRYCEESQVDHRLRSSIGSSPCRRIVAQPCPALRQGSDHPKTKSNDEKKKTESGPPKDSGPPAKSISLLVIEQLNAQQEIDRLAPELKSALERRVEDLQRAIKRQQYVRSIRDLRARATEHDKALIKAAADTDEWVRTAAPIIDGFLNAAKITRNCYRGYHDWYRQKPEMWKKSTLPDQRDKIVSNLRLARSMTDLVLGIREAAIGPRDNHPDLDSATARLVILLDRFADALRASEDQTQELLTFMDGEGALYRQMGNP